MTDDTPKPPINFKAIKRRMVREWLSDPTVDDWDDPPGTRRPVHPTVRQQVWDMTDGRCWWCGVQTTRPGTFQVDHIHPVCFGGTNDPENLVPCCKRCNDQKAYFSVEEFRARRGGGLFWFEIVKNGGGA